MMIPRPRSARRAAVYFPVYFLYGSGSTSSRRETPPARPRRNKPVQVAVPSVDAAELLLGLAVHVRQLAQVSQERPVTLFRVLYATRRSRPSRTPSS